MTLDGGGDAATRLYFINGLLYHAVTARAIGDDAVIQALNSPATDFEFDARPRLPTDHTIASPAHDLIARAATGNTAPPAEPPGDLPASPPLARRGSLAEVALSSVLEALSRERASGRLTLFDHGRPPAIMYFLHGQLYHALGGGATGDEAVISALTRSHGDYEFNTAAWLPAESSVTSSIPQLIGRWRGKVGP